MSDGVGASQVLPYVEGLARRGMRVTLHSLEKDSPAPGTALRLQAAGVEWRPHPFGAAGAAAGLARMVRAVPWLRGAELVHARSDIAAGSALLAGCDRWVWDMRGFWVEERIENGILRPGSAQHRLMRQVERRSARRAAGIVVLASTAIEVLEQRHGPEVAAKTTVIPTCVDLGRFAVSEWPERPPLRALLAGTLSRRYDVPLMLRLVEELQRRAPVELFALVPGPSPWDGTLRAAGVDPRPATGDEMPSHLARSHLGLCVLTGGHGLAVRASMPTKVGEFLASGRPVVVNPRLGDLDRLLADYDCGVILDDTPGDEVRAADEMTRLLDDPETPQRCRALAEAHFDVEKGVQALLGLYSRCVPQR